MSVEITPTGQIGFTRPLTRLVTQTIKIHNPNSAPVAFKVKTTAPKQYCVRPNSGRVESGESVEVQVLLQPLADEPPPHAKCKDKFLVQSAYISPDEEMHTLAEMWAETERTNKAAIHEQKIKSVYLAPEDGSHVNGIREEEEGELGESRVLDESGLDYQAFKTPISPNGAREQQNGHKARNLAQGPAQGGGLQGQEGMSEWTVEQEKTYDERLFRNGGQSYWETKQLPYVPTPPKGEANRQKQPLQEGTLFSAAQSSPLGQSQNNIAGVSNLAAPLPSSAQPNTASAPRDAPAAGTGAGLPELTPSAAGHTTSALARSLESTASDADRVRVLQAEVERLQAEQGNGDASDGPQVTGLRRRGGGSIAQQAGEKAEVAVEKAKEAVSTGQGVPLEVVVGLVVAVFVMTYLFF